MTLKVEKFALVTGASRGIGRGIALALAHRGYHVAINFLQDEKAASQVLEEIKNYQVESLSVCADVSKAKSAQDLIEKVQQHFGRLDVLVNNVGDFIIKPLSELTVRNWQMLLNSNLSSTFYCSKFALVGMRARGYGRIVNIALANASRVQAYKHIAAYAIAKTGVLILTKSLAVEEAANGITVNAVSPGFIDNGSTADEDILKKIPMRTFGNPQDVANAVLFLISDQAKYITGAEIVVSGGWGI